MPRHDLTLLNATVSLGGIKDLSPDSVNISVMAVSILHNRNLWHNQGTSLSDLEWDVLDSQISLCLDELMSGLVGLIVPAIFATASAFKFLPCDGGTYQRDDYPLLYDALDSQYILSGTQFTLPDLRDRFIAGAGGSYAHGDTGGTNEHTLTLAEIPAHSHSYNQYTFGVDIESVGVPDPTGVGQPTIPQNTSNAGSGNAHENRPPFFAIPFYVIAS